MGNYTIFKMFENPRRGRQARNFTSNVAESGRSFTFCFKCIEASRASGYPTPLSTFETEMAARYFERPVCQPRPQGDFPWLWR